MNRVVFVDLDDTLFQTRRKNGSAAIPAALDRAGRPHSYQSDIQAAFFDWICKDAILVPVTGRNFSALKRVILPLGNYAICSYGGAIIGPDGKPEPSWRALMEEGAKESALKMSAAQSAIEDLAATLKIDCRLTLVHDDDLPLYLSVKHNQDQEGEMKTLARAIQEIAPLGWSLHLNGSNFALLPSFLGKEKAVSFFLERVLEGPGALTIGIGDSLTDMPFMGLMHYAAIPTESQIFNIFSRYVSPACAWSKS